MKIKILSTGCVLALFAIVAGFVIFNLSGLGDIESDSTEILGGSRYEGTNDLLLNLGIYLVGGIIVGGIFIIFILPRFAESVADKIFYQSPGELAKSALDSARSMLQQGKYEEAVEELDSLIESDTDEAMVFFEKSRIQHERLENSEEAIETLRKGMTFKEWEMDDDVTFGLILGSLLLEANQDRDGAVELYKDIIEKYPESEFHTNLAKVELLEMGVVV